ncbi:pollen-specific leucine-rich repeat extensin protein [Salix suchowensis]|nr:pollen-specific leucine-rich repeat extensin protein [Salix suchowensis]
MLAQKDWETARLKDQLLLRDTTISKLRSLVELAWTEFDSVNKTNINPQASAVEKHDEEESVQDINGTASIGVTNHHGNTATSAHVSSVQGEPPSLVSTFNGPQPPPTDAKTQRAVGPILSFSKSKGRPPPPPPPQRHPSPLPPRMEANILGATQSPVSAFNIAPRPPPPPPRMEANILGATRSPVGAFNITPRPPPPPPRMEANILGATQSPVGAFNIAPRPPPPRMEANILGATQSPVAPKCSDLPTMNDYELEF